MVQDTRVSRQLARLGGVYRDPARVNRDSSALLKSSVGSTLTPIAAVHTDDSGGTHTVLVLQGTIAIHFRGNTYQLLMDIYLVPGYPNRPPVCYVRLAPNMYLKENHRHVGSDGKVYLPYLHEWRPTTHNLVELTVAMSSVFSADPPVFSRPTATATTSTPTTNNTHDPPPFSQALDHPNPVATSIVSSIATAASNTNVSPSSDWRSQQQQLEAIMAKEAAEANAAAEAARRAEQAERDAEARKQAYEASQLKSLQGVVLSKVQKYCRRQADLTQDFAKEDAKDKEELQKGQDISEQLQFYKKKKTELEEHCALVTARTSDLQDWLHEYENTTTTAATKTRTVDEICDTNAVHGQMFDLAAENASISDALYFLDRALYQSQLTVTQHLRQVRKLAKRQFLVRQHLLKIQQSQLSTC